MSAMLTVCAACERHFRSNEPACPFCGAEPARAAGGHPPSAAPSLAGLSRARVIALGAAGVLGTLAAASCTPVAVYGGPPTGGYGGYGADTTTTTGAGGAGGGGGGLIINTGAGGTGGDGAGGGDAGTH
jgi:hypothetical protein